MSETDDDKPRWTLPRRTRMESENLHISSFLLVKNSSSKDSILLLRAGASHPVAFKRGKLLMPARVLSFGENPRKVAEALMNEQMDGAQSKGVDFVTMQSYLGAHWDIVFLFETAIDSLENLKAKMPFTELGFFKLSNLPTKEIAEDHLEVLEELKKEERAW